MFEGSALNEDGGIVQCLVIVESMRVEGAIKIAGNAAFCAIDDKIGGIGVNAQLHVASKKAEHCIWIYCQVIHQHGALLSCVDCWLCLVCGDFVVGGEDSAIDGSAVI
eukprot:11144800-Ditylum_brightwellii.AAC.1